MAVQKMLQQVAEAYVWEGMRRTIKDRLAQCPTCRLRDRHEVRVPMGDMPYANYPMQIIGMDISGPVRESPQGNRYALTIIDHCSGWVEAFPLPNKTNQTVWRTFSNEFISRHGIPEVLVTDNGGEFTQREFEQYLAQLGIDHRHTTPAHPQSNGRTERFHRTFKTILEKLVNNAPHQWEDRLNDALLAYRTAVSSTTGYSPYYLLYGKRPRLPLTRTLAVKTENVSGNRLDDLTRALQFAKQATEHSRMYNRERLQRKANAGHLKVGDTVIVKAEARDQFTSR